MALDLFDLKFRDFATGTDRVVATLQPVLLSGTRCMNWDGSGLVLSPDERSFLFGKATEFAADVMLVENFR